MTEDDATLVEIGVLRRHDQAVLPGLVPDSHIVRRPRQAVMHMDTAGKNILQPFGQNRREIFVEQQLHAEAKSNCFSRSAA